MHSYGQLRAILSAIHRAWIKVDWMVAYGLFVLTVVAIYVASH